MKIVVVGRGNVGGGLARLWSRAGHDVTALGQDGGDVRVEDGIGPPRERQVLRAIHGGAHRLAHPPRSAGDGDPRHAARGSAAGQTPATASVKAASSGPIPAAESASGAQSSSTSAPMISECRRRTRAG